MYIVKFDNYLIMLFTKPSSINTYTGETIMLGLKSVVETVAEAWRERQWGIIVIQICACVCILAGVVQMACIYHKYFR